MEIKINLDDSKIQTYQGLVLRAYPKPENSELTDEQWFKRQCKRFILSELKGLAQVEAVAAADQLIETDN